MIWPKDRLTLVLAIEKYYLKNKRLPDTLGELTTPTAFIATQEALSQSYFYIKDNGHWEIKTWANYPVAKGN